MKIPLGRRTIIIALIVVVAGIGLYVWTNPGVYQRISGGQSAFGDDTGETTMSQSELAKLKNNPPDESAPKEEQIQHYQLALIQSANLLKCDEAEELYTKLTDIRGQEFALDALVLIDCYTVDAKDNKKRIDELFAVAERQYKTTSKGAERDQLRLAIDSRRGMIEEMK